MSSAGVSIERPAGFSGWRPLLRAAGQTGASAVAGAALSAAATKIFAAMLGPAEVAVLATLQQIRQAGMTCATLNGQTALVQGLSARDGAGRLLFLRTALVLMAAALAVVAAVLLAAPGWVAASTGLGARAGMVRWLVLPVAFSSALVFSGALLSARGEIGKLALVQTVSPAAMALLVFPVARMVRGQAGARREDALVWWLAASAACAAAAGLLALLRTGARERGEGRRSSQEWWNRHSARGFLAVSGSMFAAGAAASLVLLALRAQILNRQGLAVAGQFDAAWAISMNHVSLVLASLQAYCLPALARTSGRAERGAQLTRMLTLAALAAAAMICVLATLKPVALALFYSGAFREASLYLRWTLLGDYLKVSSWVLSIPMLASADMRMFLAAELTAYGVFAAGAKAAGYFRGAAEATAIAFVAMYAAHLAVCGAIAWRRYGFRPDRRAWFVWTAGMAAVAVVSALNWRAG